MPRIPHGMAIAADGFVAVAATSTHSFDYLFPTLQTGPDSLLPDDRTPEKLRQLAATMADDVGDEGNSSTPAAYTYFGQFVDHDITFEERSGRLGVGPGDLLSDDLLPLSLETVRATLRNTRTATLDLDSVYGGQAGQPPVPRDPRDAEKLMIGEVTDAGDRPGSDRPPGKAAENDLPRQPPNPADPTTDRAALTGDPRNDENTILAQLAVAFLKAHNGLVDAGLSFDQARRTLRQHYQHIVIHDHLRRVADPTIVDDILANGNRWFNVMAEPFFLPLEFSVAAYRYGHSMVRASYDFNLNFDAAGNAPGGSASLERLFTFTALSGEMENAPSLPENWIIEWENIIGDAVGPGGRARKLDTRLSAMNGETFLALFNLQDSRGDPLPGLAARLAARNLLRGYMLRMPTGQAVASLLGIHTLTESELRSAVGPEQAAVLDSTGLIGRTPLWFYILAEAAHYGGECLGPVGSTIIAEVLIGLVRRSEDSVLRTPGWRPSLPSLAQDRFELADLLRFAGVLPGGIEIRVHTVADGETLSAIAETELGDGSRWPEIFAANRAVVRRFDVIFPGMQLILPTGPPPAQQLRFMIVTPGDTLSALALERLGDMTRWAEIFALNGDVLTNPDVLVAGQVLQLPPL